MNCTNESKLTIKKNDQVQIIAGKEKGKVGKVLKVNAKANTIFVEKANMVKKHTKATQRETGGIFEKEGAVHYSNVQLYCPKCARGVRHGLKAVEGTKGVQKKVRVCKRCNESIDKA